MARTVDEVNENIRIQDRLIAAQQAVIEDMQKQINENNQEHEALKRQKETLETTYTEIENLCSALYGECSSVKDTFGGSNGFANGYGDVMQQNVESTKNTILKKISSMVERIQDQMTECENLLRNASEALNNANEKINIANDKVVTFNQELQQAEEEAALAEAGL